MSLSTRLLIHKIVHLPLHPVPDRTQNIMFEIHRRLKQLRILTSNTKHCMMMNLLYVLFKAAKSSSRFIPMVGMLTTLINLLNHNHKVSVIILTLCWIERVQENEPRI